jgi:hypothetical protein
MEDFCSSAADADKVSGRMAAPGAYLDFFGS